MRAAALLLLAAGAPALAQSSTTSDGFVAPKPLVCGAAPTAATPYAVVEWPQDFYYNSQFQQPPKPLGLRWCNEPGDRAGSNFSAAPWFPCAVENGRCMPPAFPAAVLYTTGDPTPKSKPPLRTWSAPIKVVSGSIPCTNGAFGRDPMYGIVKACWYRLFALEAPTHTSPLGAGYQVGSYFFTR